MRVAGRAEAIGVCRIASDVVKVSPEICQIIFERKRFRLGPLDLFEFLGFVKGDLCLSGVQFERRVPPATFWAVEPAAQRVRVGERGVHDVGVGHAEKQFVDADAGKQVGLSQESVIGGAIELEKLLQLLVIVRQAGENAFVAVAGRDQPVNVVLADV